MLKDTVITESKINNYLIYQFCRNDYYHQNSYLIIDNENKKQFLLDPGSDINLLDEYIVKNKFPLNAIVLTHGHFDHTISSQYISDKYDIYCYIHNSDISLLKKSPNYALLFDKKKIKPPVKIKSFSEFLNNPFKIVHTPGHTEGSCCLFLGNIVFTGDTILKDEIGRTDLPGGSKEKLSVSINNLLKHFNNETIIYPGHGHIFNFSELNLHLR